MTGPDPAGTRTARPPVELVIFDCDGVLVDSERIAVGVHARILADLGCDFTRAEIVDLFVGSSKEVYRRAVEERLGRALAPDWQEPYEHLYQEAYAAGGLTPVDGVGEALAALTVPLCVASNTRAESVRMSLRRTGLDPWFGEHVFSATEVARGKPAPDLFLHAARGMGVPPDRCAVVEDSAYGAAAARAAGMRVFAYCAGLTPAERLAGPGTVVFDDMRRLPELIEQQTAPE
ncbi:HAD family hydrolase [Streptomyces sp. NPDC056909]|uniref:HAD family hydrolase n=1 Tax=Streptomyces sp. NPDC056909 TaxID=3345963 RepID=UPI0036B19324